MPTVTYGENNEGELHRYLDINALGTGVPALIDGVQLQASVVDAGQGIKLVIIVVPAASGPAAPSETPAPATS